MKWLACASALVFVIGAAYQDSLPAIFQQHAKALRDAQSLSGVVSVTPLGEAPTEIRFAYNKPNLLKVTTPDGFTLIDGKTVYTYSAKDKTYTEAPATDAAVAAALRKDLWAWSAFFSKADKDLAKAAKAGSQRNMKGVVVTEVAVTPSAEGFGQVVLYVDPKLGFARGFNLKTQDKEYIAIASELKASSDPLPASEFTFTVPTGAKKAEPKPAAAAASYEAVQKILDQSCMPCHSDQQQSAGIVLTSYSGVSQIVVPGQPAQSRLIMSLKGQGAKRMPKNRAPLPADQIKLIEDWIAAGAKQ